MSERVEALVRVGAPPRRLTQTFPVLPAQLLAVAERDERFVGALPGVSVESLASAFTDLDVGHDATSPGIMARGRGTPMAPPPIKTS